MDKASPFEDSIEDCGCQVFVVQNPSPLTERLVEGEDHGPFSEMAIVNREAQWRLARQPHGPSRSAVLPPGPVARPGKKGREMDGSH